MKTATKIAIVATLVLIVFVCAPAVSAVADLIEPHGVTVERLVDPR